MPGGRPRKKPKVISGLRNQPTNSSPPLTDVSLEIPSTHSTLEERSQAPSPSNDEGSDAEPSYPLFTAFDSLKINYALDGSDSEDSELSEWEDLNDDMFSESLAQMTFRDDPKDKDWIPEELKRALERQEAKRKSRPKTYAKGPDVMSKSKRTRKRYQKSWKNQSRLDRFGFGSASDLPTSASCTAEPDTTGPPDSLLNPDPTCSGTSDITLPVLISQSRARSASVLSEPSADEATSEDVRDAANEVEGPIDEEEGEDGDESEVEGDGEDYEDDLVENVQGAAEIRDWATLRTKIKAELKKNGKTLPLSHINQLLILSNFATLRLKGSSRITASLEIAKQWHEGKGTWFARRVRMLARHYQIFEKLPVEKRGGSANARSWLYDELVQKQTLDWLRAQPTGKVTPRGLQHALNSAIFPELNIRPKKPFSERTARRWLIKLGWRRTVVRKGVYMDGHEREDVVRYRNEVFLPAIACYEARMVHFEGAEMKRVEPVLQPGEKRIIAQFHDECCFHMNDEARSLWLRDGEQPLRKKGRGRLIHVSDFINEEDGRLVLRDGEGNIIRDARKIIYPGSNGDPWWDTEQLLVQVKDGIEIFEAAHPDCQALFVFDQSAAHGSLAPDALRAFDMNKSNGGKQRRQHDTIIPQSNPVESLRGLPQSMTTPSGEAKGLQAVLEERGFHVHKLRAKCSPVCPFESQNCCMARLLSQQDDFANQPSMLETLIKEAGHESIFLPKFHCELNPIEMYWGWSKYRYREASKPKFADAKRVALECLNACPVEVFRRFINRSWRFMSAYRLGLTGKAAAWAVRKQKQHRAVSQGAMSALEAVLN